MIDPLAGESSAEAGSAHPDSAAGSLSDGRSVAVAVLLALEGIGAGVLVGCGIRWVLVAASTVRQEMSFPLPTERLSLVLDVPRLLAYLIPLALLAAALVLSAIWMWRARGPSRSFDGRRELMVKSLLVAQPLLFALPVSAGLLIGYDEGTDGGFGIGFVFANSQMRGAFLALVASGCVGLLLAGVAMRKMPRVPRAALGLSIAVVAALFASAVATAPIALDAPGLGFSSAVFVPTGVVQLPVVACPGPQSCVAFGTGALIQPEDEFAAVALTTDGGDRWHAFPFPVQALLRATRSPGISSFEAFPMLSCPTRQICYLANADTKTIPSSAATELPVARSEDGGRNWRIFPAPGRLGSDESDRPLGGGLACMTASKCVLIDGREAVITRDAAASWSVIAQRQFPSSPKTASTWDGSGVTCSDRSHCVLYFSEEISTLTSSADQYRTTALASFDGGRSWHDLALPQSVGLVYSLWCRPSGTCLLTADTKNVWQLAVSTDAGRTWAISSGKTTPERELTCASSRECLALGASGERAGLLESRDGGLSWRLRLAGSFFSFACFGTNFCTLSGVPSGLGANFLETTTDGGATWHRSMFPLSRVPWGQRPYVWPS